MQVGVGSIRRNDPRMTSATSTPSIAPASASHAPEASATEAAAFVTTLLRSARSAIPPELLTAHLTRLYGDAGFPILRAAAEATLRRLQIVATEALRVQQRPAGGFRGEYRTGRRRQKQRPYRTTLASVEPLRGSCDCPDFTSNSLGLCKHLLTVLGDLASRPRRLQAAQQLGTARRDAPALSWQPVKPLLGDGDWLRQVELDWPTANLRAPARWQSLRRRFVAGGDGLLRLRELHAGDAKARLLLLADLQHGLAGAAGGGDPALLACIADERERLLAAQQLQSLGRRGGTPRGFRRELYPYQQEGVARFLRNGRLLLADDMGLGKTTQAVAACHQLFAHDHVQRGLLLVPAPLKQQWLREWRACCSLPIDVVEGTPEQRAACYNLTRSGFLLANYEQLLRDLELVQRWQPDLVLLDEAQRIKNWETRTAATVKQLQPRFRLVLTGTPFENRLVELDSILEWLDRRPLQPLWRLMPFHGAEDNAGLLHLDVLRARLSPVLLRRRRLEVLDQLPPRTDTRIDLALTPAQRQEHDDRIMPIAQLMKIAERRPLLRAEFLKLMRLFTEQRIIANGMAQFSFVDLWPGIAKAKPEPALLEGLSMPKLAELRLLLQQVVIAQGRKVVVFSQWQRGLQLAAWAVGDMLSKAGVRCAFFTGAQSARRRDENIVAFHDDPDLRVLFATDAGGVGLNLQRAASCCVHFDLPWNPAVFEQRVGRVWRLGQTSKVDVYSLVSEQCIESRMAEVLKTKQASFSALFDGESDEVRFEGQGGFLAAARRIASGAEAVPGGRQDVEVEVDVEVDAEQVGAMDVLEEDAEEQGEVAELVAESRQPEPALDAGAVRGLLAGLSVKPRADGGMVLEADPESAAVLAEVLRGLAGVIEGAVGRRV